MYCHNCFDYLPLALIRLNKNTTSDRSSLFIIFVRCDLCTQECKGGYTILHEAVKTGNANLVNYILQHSGIDIEKRNYAQLTPYQLSTYYPNIGRILLEKGAARLVKVDDESDDEDFSSDESDYDYYDEFPTDYDRTNEVIFSDINSNNGIIKKFFFVTRTDSSFKMCTSKLKKGGNCHEIL